MHMFWRYLVGMMLTALFFAGLGVFLVWSACRQAEFERFALFIGISWGAPAGGLVGAFVGLILMRLSWPGFWPFRRR
jgi:hypothetical protein